MALFTYMLTVRSKRKVRKQIVHGTDGGFKYNRPVLCKSGDDADNAIKEYVRWTSAAGLLTRLQLFTGLGMRTGC